MCSDGVVLKAHSQILMLSSTVLRNAASQTLKVGHANMASMMDPSSGWTSRRTMIPVPLQVEGTSTTWRNVLMQLYPIHPRPDLSYGLISNTLRVVVTYDMGILQVTREYRLMLSSLPNLTCSPLLSESRMPCWRSSSSASLRS